MQLTLGEIADGMGAVGDLEGQAGLLITKVQTDSRLIQGGELFVCLQGRHFDGHAFAQAAVTRGAGAVLAERPLDAVSGVPILYVRDSLLALGKLAGMWRKRFSGTVLAITGSVGKTTTKESLSGILDHSGEIGKNYKNFNNQLGVPLSVLSFSGQEKFWVLEAGVSIPGDMDLLASIILPDLAVITNVGPVHLEGLKSVQGVAEEKLKLLHWLQPGGQVVASLDYPELAVACARFPASFFSREQRSGADCWGSYLGPDRAGRGRYVLHLAEERLEVLFPYSGAFFLENILASALAAHLLGVSLAQIRQGLQTVRLPEHRCALRRLGRFVLLDDCYNANPLSMARSLQNARELSGQSPLILVLGEMKELGVQAPRLHRQLGRDIAGSKADLVLYCGDYGQEVRQGLQDGAWTCEFCEIASEREFRQIWQTMDIKRGTILFKGSRGCRLERFVRIVEEDL